MAKHLTHSITGTIGTFSAVICALMSFHAVATQAADPQLKTGTAIEIHGALEVKGHQILDRNNIPFSVAGPSLFWGNDDWGNKAAYPPDAYYNRQVVTFVLNQWNAPIIRIAMGAESRGGYIDDPVGRWAKISAVAQAAIDQGMYVIVDWHSHHAHEHTADAVAFFTRVAETWGHQPNLIYEIYNEPLDSADWQDDVKPYAETVITAIRKIDPDNLILVGTPTWSQDVDQAADDPIVNQRNIAYTLHFYAGTHGQALRDKAEYAMDLGLPLFVSEWGTVNANGDGGVHEKESRVWLAFMREHQLSHLNWSLHSKLEGASMLNPGTRPDGKWTDTDLTPSGLLVSDVIRHWHAHDYHSPDH